MTERKIILIIQLVVVIGLTLGIVIGIFTSNQNLLGSMILFLLPMAIIVGLTSPVTGILLLLMLSGYIEHYKRLTMLFTDFTGLDLIIILALPPCLMASAVVGTSYQSIMGRFRAARWIWLIFWLCAVYSVLILIIVMPKAGFARAGQAVANGPLYSYMLFVIPILFPTVQRLRQLIVLVVVLYIPVALYGIYQSVYGFADFEIEYITSGYTLLVLFYYIGDLRPFSTLSEPTALGACSGIMACYAAALWIARREIFKHPYTGWLILSLVPLFIYSNYISMVRSTFGIVPFAILVFLATQKKGGTILLYITAAAGYVSLIVFSNDIIRNIYTIQSFVDSILGVGRLSTVLTFTARLQSFERLRNPSTYSLFGLEDPGPGHDNLTLFITYYGVVPLVIFMMIAGYTLWKLHQTIWNMQNPRLKRMASLLLGTFLGTFLVGMIAGSVVGTFPINVFMWLSLAAALSIARQDVLNTKAQRPPPRPAAAATSTSAIGPG